jgi:hypothetical protein
METNMKSLSRVNMAAVTRLTREGRLDEAMHLLRGGLDDAAGAASPGSARTAGDEASIIDMEPPSTTNGGAWTVPSSASPTPAPRPPSSRSTLRATLA